MKLNSYFSKWDRYIMDIAVNISKDRVGSTANNPAVACIITKNNKIIASAYTGLYGKPHAESLALDLAGEESKGSNMYVTLEPCAHYGKTPPCVEKIIKCGIKNIYFGLKDPDPRVNGLGIQKLLEANINLYYGAYTEQVTKLFQGHIKKHNLSIPYITIKIATSLDGKIALSNHKSKWISNVLSRQYSHRLRAINDAILVGIGTVLHDNPFLSCRLPGLESWPLAKIVIDPKLHITMQSNIIKNASINSPIYIIYNQAQAVFNKQTEQILTSSQNVTLISMEERKLYNSPPNPYTSFPRYSFDNLNFKEILKMVGKIGINNLLIEGGSKTITNILKQRLFNKLIWIRSNKIIGNDGIACFDSLNLEELEETYQLTLCKQKNFEDDCCYEYISDY